MLVHTLQFQRFARRTVFVAALTLLFLKSGIAQTQDSTVPQESAAQNDSSSAKSSNPPNENDSVAEASKQASNPLASVWLVQIQQNTNWIELPTNKDIRVQSNLQFQPLMPVKLADNWTLITRPVIQIFNSTPFRDQNGQEKRVTAFGDTVLAFALSPGPKLVGNWLLAAGPSLIFPTATDSRIGQDKWQVQPDTRQWISGLFAGLGGGVISRRLFVSGGFLCLRAARSYPDDPDCRGKNSARNELTVSLNADDHDSPPPAR